MKKDREIPDSIIRIVKYQLLRLEDFKQKKEIFEKSKNEFYEDMEKYFQSFKEVPKSISFKNRLNEIDEAQKNLNDSKANLKSEYTVTRVERVSVKFDVDKLEKALGKKSKVIEKTFIIANYEGLVKYLKTCNVDPKKFKSFLQVDKAVNQKELDRLSDTGEIRLEDIKGTYTTTVSKPYFKITNGEQKE